MGDGIDVELISGIVSTIIAFYLSGSKVLWTTKWVK
jgi:hypothetical protein